MEKFWADLYRVVWAGNPVMIVASNEDQAARIAAEHFRQCGFSPAVTAIEKVCPALVTNTLFEHEPEHEPGGVVFDLGKV